jgi:hypothetical protein
MSPKGRFQSPRQTSVRLEYQDSTYQQHPHPSSIREPTPIRSQQFAASCLLKVLPSSSDSSTQLHPLLSTFGYYKRVTIASDRPNSECEGVKEIAKLSTHKPETSHSHTRRCSKPEFRGIQDPTVRHSGSPYLLRGVRLDVQLAAHDGVVFVRLLRYGPNTARVILRSATPRGRLIWSSYANALSGECGS